MEARIRGGLASKEEVAAFEAEKEARINEGLASSLEEYRFRRNKRKRDRKDRKDRQARALATLYPKAKCLAFSSPATGSRAGSGPSASK